MKQHIGTTKHDTAANRNKDSQKTQTLLTEHQQPKINQFNLDLCKSFLEANIPLKKVSHPSIIRLFETYTKNSMPCESILRQKYVPMLFDNCMETLREKAKDKYIWVSLDETTDSKQRMVANFVFGIMDSDENSSERGKSYLLNMTTVDAANANNMAKFFNDSLLLLWPKGKCCKLKIVIFLLKILTKNIQIGIQYDKVLLVLTDAAAYMIASMRSLQILFPKMLHLTCFDHGLHRVAEFIRAQFPNVNKLIANTKAVFSKVF